MGIETSHVCRSCGTEFTVQQEGSRKSDVLHCDVCGARTYVLLVEVQDLYLRYHRTPLLAFKLDNTGRRVQYVSPAAARERAEYHAAVEGTLGPCACGGRYRYAAPPRCPGCLSTEEMWDVDETGEVVFHD
jgi:DNA-directed RNA polymerase subunit RPC12/RpoP